MGRTHARTHWLPNLRRRQKSAVDYGHFTYERGSFGEAEVVKQRGKERSAHVRLRGRASILAGGHVHHSFYMDFEHRRNATLELLFYNTHSQLTSLLQS